MVRITRSQIKQLAMKPIPKVIQLVDLLGFGDREL